MGNAGRKVKGVIKVTGEQYLAEIGRIAQMIDRKEIDTFECAILLAKALSKRQAYLKKHPEVKTRPNPEKNVIIRRGTTEWDVYHALSMKRLKKNGIHL